MAQIQNTSIWKAILNFRMLSVLVLGFSSGLPLLLVGGTLKIWLARESVDISTIGYFSWVGMAYSLKFIWAPIIDSYQLLRIGRRKGWMILAQLFLTSGFFAMSLLDPKVSLIELAMVSLVVGFFSATQDIVIDAYRREILEDNELGIGSSFAQYGYRVAMLISGGVGVGLINDHSFGFHDLYRVMGIIMLLMMVLTFFVPEPKVVAGLPKTLMDAVIQPIREFLGRDQGLILLSFVFFFKLGDALSGAMLNPFYVQMGFSNQDIGLIAKTVGLASSLIGLFLGGIIIYKMGVLRSLWIFGILQALSTAGFSLIVWTGPQNWALACAVVFEDISAGMGSAAFVAFIASITNKKFTGTQYALLSSLATLGRNFFSGFTGKMVEVLGWSWFFWTCALIALPGLVLLGILSSRSDHQSSNLNDGFH